MYKKIIFYFFYLVTFLTQIVNAEVKLGNAGALSGTFGIASQYLNFGEDLNRNKPAAYGFLEYQTPEYGLIKPYFNIWVGQSINDKNVDSEDATWQYEVDYALGFRANLQNLDVDLSYKLVTLKKGRNIDDSSPGEYDAKLSYPITKNFVINGNYFLSDTKGQTLGTTKEIKKDVYELGFSYDFGPVKTVVLYRDVAKYSENYELALQKNLYDLDFEIRYSALDYKGIFDSQENENNLVFSVSKSF